jgi:hypothetical protein
MAFWQMSCAVPGIMEGVGFAFKRRRMGAGKLDK